MNEGADAYCNSETLPLARRAVADDARSDQHDSRPMPDALTEVDLTEQDHKETSVQSPDGPAQPNEAREKAVQQRATGQPLAVAAETPQGQAEAKAVSTEDALKESAENRDRWMRAVAELENYKKRTIQERTKLLKYRNEDLLRDLLGVVDNMDRALGHCQTEGRSDALADGVCMIATQFHDLLSKHGVTEMKALGETFDPHVHEALAQVPVADGEPNRVIEVLEKGYFYQDRLLRPAKVAVSAVLNRENADTAGPDQE
jgi:molecular chaperone GrpE